MQPQASLEHKHAACYLQQGLATDEQADCSHPVEALQHHPQMPSVRPGQQQAVPNKHKLPQLHQAKEAACR